MPPKKRQRNTVTKRAERSVPCTPDVTALRPARRLAVWDGLPPALRDQMSLSGVKCAADLASLSADGARAIVGSDPRVDMQVLQAWLTASASLWRARGPERSSHIVLEGSRALLRMTAQGGTSTATVGGTLGLHLPLGAAGDVVPSVTLAALGSAARSGSDVFKICQRVVPRLAERAANKIADLFEPLKLGLQILLVAGSAGCPSPSSCTRLFACQA